MAARHFRVMGYVAGALVIGAALWAHANWTRGAYIPTKGMDSGLIPPGASFDAEATETYIQSTLEWPRRLRLVANLSCLEAGVFKLPLSTEVFGRGLEGEAYRIEREKFQVQTGKQLAEQSGCLFEPDFMGKGGSLFVRCENSWSAQILDHEECCGTSRDEAMVEASPNELIIVLTHGTRKFDWLLRYFE